MINYGISFVALLTQYLKNKTMSFTVSGERHACLAKQCGKNPGGLEASHWTCEIPVSSSNQIRNQVAVTWPCVSWQGTFWHWGTSSGKGNKLISLKDNIKIIWLICRPMTNIYTTSYTSVVLFLIHRRSWRSTAVSALSWSQWSKN